MTMAKKHPFVALFLAGLLLGTACSSDDSEDASPEGTDEAAVDTGDESDDGVETDDGDQALEEGWVIAEVTAGAETFEVRAICAVNGDRITLTTDSVDNSVAVEEPGGTIVIRVGDGEDPTNGSIWSVTGADVTVEAGRLIATGTAENPLVAGAVVAEPADVTVEADCPDA